MSGQPATSPTEPPSAATLLQRAIALHRDSAFAEAERAYAEVLRLEPGHRQALQLSGAVALKLGRPEDAADRLGRAIAISPSAEALTD